MTDRAEITLRNVVDREMAVAWVKSLPDGTRVEFKGPTRSLAQNSRLWPLLERVSQRMTLGGRAWDAEAWKCIFMRAMGRETPFLPDLNGQGFFPQGFRSSKLSRREMADMQTFIESYCAEQGVDIWADAEAAE
jgi:hypothetical protein